MRVLIFLLFIFGTFNLKSQIRIIQGKVIDEQLNSITAVIINLDSVLLGRTDSEGNFKIEVPLKTKSILFRYIGMERNSIRLDKDCNHLDVIMMQAANYDFMTMAEVDGERMKQFKHLLKLHKQAYKKGIFIAEKPCYKDIFIPRED